MDDDFSNEAKVVATLFASEAVFFDGKEDEAEDGTSDESDTGVGGYLAEDWAVGTASLGGA